MKPDIKSFSRFEELRSPSKTAQSLLSRHIARSRLILEVQWTAAEEQSSSEAFAALLEVAKGGFLLERFVAVGISTLIDLKHLAGLTTLWEYRDLLSTGMGLFRFGRNWAFMTTFLSRVRQEEQDSLGTVSTPAILKHGMYRDKYRTLNDTLWRPKAAKKVRMVDLDSDTEEGRSTQGACTAEKAVVPREVLRLRAINLLNLPRFH